MTPNPDLITISKIKQKLAIALYETNEMRKAIERFRREFASPIFIQEFGREVTLDFDDPLYPYCPYRLTRDELFKYVDISEKGGELHEQKKERRS